MGRPTGTRGLLAISPIANRRYRQLEAETALHIRGERRGLSRSALPGSPPEIQYPAARPEKRLGDANASARLPTAENPTVRNSPRTLSAVGGSLAAQRNA